MNHHVLCVMTPPYVEFDMAYVNHTVATWSEYSTCSIKDSHNLDLKVTFYGQAITWEQLGLSTKPV